LLLKLVRLSELEDSTLGIVLLDNKPLWKTIELPWRDNQPMVSCIPTGEYTAVKYSSPKFGRALHIVDVPGRSAILIHPANMASELHGCIAPGLNFGTMEGRPCVWESKKAMERILDAARNFEEIKIRIVSVID
jgi:hypothetical protein